VQGQGKKQLERIMEAWWVSVCRYDWLCVVRVVTDWLMTFIVWAVARGTRARTSRLPLRRGGSRAAFNTLLPPHAGRNMQGQVVTTAD
jgi:hypothetical protein